MALDKQCEKILTYHTVKPDELVELKPFEETDCLEPFKLKLKPNIFL